MRRIFLMIAALLMVAAGSSFVSTPAVAGASTVKYGVRILRLTPPDRSAVSKKIAPQLKHSVAPHRHTIRLRKGQRVIVTFADGIGRSRYRRRHPGIARPWSWRHSAGRRDFMNPRGLYTSKIYRRGYY